MPITTQDIKLFASKVMSDVPEGGGGPTGTVLQSGKSNNIFRDIREQDRAGGNLSMRQVHLGITSGDTDVGMGCNIIISQPPADPNVSIVLMATKDDFATRAEDIARLEAGYIIASAYSGALLGDHLQGMRTMSLQQHPDNPLPVPGQRLALVYLEGSANQVTQFVSVRKVEHTLQKFNDGATEYLRRIVTLQLGQTLSRDYPGFDVTRYDIKDTELKARTKIRTTVWGNAAKYYGVQPLAATGALGSYSVRVPSIYERVVPSAEAESPMVDAIPIAGAALPVPGVQDVTVTTTQIWNTNTNLVLPAGILPGSLQVTHSTGVLTDKGGQLMAGNTQVGTVDYANGLCVLTTGTYNGSKSITYRPAAYMQRIPQSSEVLVTAESRSQSYTGFILPLAQPGTLSITYMAQGNWYTLQDDGSGQLRGSESSHGAGTYNPDTGSYLVTLGALPDVGSSIILYWGVPTQETQWPVEPVPLYQDLTLDLPEGASIYPGGLTITWQDGSSTKTATAALDMSLTGDASGQVYAGDNRIRFRPNTLPPVGTQINVQIDAAPATTEHFEHPSRDGEGALQITASQGGWVPASVRVQWNTLTDVGVLEDKYVAVLRDPTQDARDDGAGNLLLNGQVVGTVDYTLGKVHFMPDVQVKIPKPQFVNVEKTSSSTVDGVGRIDIYRQAYSGLAYTPAPSTYPNDETGWVKITYYTNASPSQHTQTVPFAPVLDVLPGVLTPLVPGSVLLTTPGGAVWADRLGGLLQELSGGAWQTRGTLDMTTGRAQLTSWQVGAAPTLTRSACTSTLGDALANVYIFRTASAPIRSASLSLQLPAPGGGVQIVTSNAQGNLLGDGVRGTVDVTTGLVRLAFGRMVNKAGQEDAPWYNPDTVEGDQVWQPEAKVMATLRYAAVAYEYIPVDPEIIGVNPVRLPADGRVPIFEVGDYVVVHSHTSEPAQTVVDGQTIDLGVERLSRIVITGSDGADIQHGWARDLDAGKVHVLDCQQWAQPVTITRSIEHMALVREAQITGQITLNRPLTHDFEAGNSYLSSALMLGDRYARVSVMFDQQSWNGVQYLDYVSGSVAVATYNSTTHPVEVDNTGCITQRWAIQFTSTSAYRVIGERVGEIATGTTAVDCRPLNPNTGTPYFTLRKEGWGSGWVAGNLLRLNTIGAGSGFCLVRAVQPGDYASLDHRFSLLARVDVDRPGAGD